MNAWDAYIDGNATGDPDLQMKEEPKEKIRLQIMETELVHMQFIILCMKL